MDRYAQSLSTIGGLTVLLGSIILVFIGKMDSVTLLAIVPSCAVAIGVPQRIANTTVRADDARITNIVVPPAEPH